MKKKVIKTSQKKSDPADKIWLPLLPLRNVVILPKTIQPIIVGRGSSIKAVEVALHEEKAIFVTAQKNPDTEQPTIDDIYKVGIKANILQMMRLPNGALKILVEGLARSEIKDMQSNEEFSEVTCIELPTISLKRTVEIEALWRQLQDMYAQYIKLNEHIPAELLSMVRDVDDMDNVIDTLAIHINLTFDERQSFLEIRNFKNRLEKIIHYLIRENDILETERRIKGRVQHQVEKNQREYYLTEQIKAIQKELGREDVQTEVNETRSQIKKLKLPKEAQERVEKELRRLEQMPPLSSEAVVSKNYIDWIISLPWHEESKDTISLKQAEDILNSDHAWLTKAKERIIEFLAAKKFSKNHGKATIICLVGPPGVGKTSLAASIAKSLGRDFVRISLGGVRDEAEIRGHRRTYIGALPGKIIQAMKKAHTINPVILLDEIDKMSSDFHGDPASAMLEVLDPEQNKTFVDHFLDIEYDLSKVMFITTANMLDGIPYPLLDRMEIIALDGYTEEEKLTIARKFLIPKNIAQYNLEKKNIVISDEILRTLINEYTKEAGVRSLERIIAKIMRKSIQEFLKNKKLNDITITPDLIFKWLGYAKFKKSNLDKLHDRIGIAVGLAWTEVGGDVLEIEGTVYPGKGNVTLTGQLGDVMQESAQAALSYVRSRAKELGIPYSTFANRDIHLHIPEGATPKDGPSAGITMCTALVSVLTKNAIKPDIAMTGEITLRGRILSVGGLREKILAARRYGMKKVLVPKDNSEDIKEIIKDIPHLEDTISIEYVDQMDQVLKLVLEKDPFDVKKTREIKPKKKRPKKS
ncbi:MAG TPA: endopeptidase La [Candidatus Babeliales bacterium]|nr:endopeptidase La [Candidatus Babeliales bacterium]